MGRLDDASKLKVVELRKAGLSFRKIKAVLELENIKVSAQAIYLFLREFQGRPPGRVRPEETVNSLATLSTAQILAGPGGRQDSWSSLKMQSMLRQASQYTGFATAAGHARQTITAQEASGSPSGSAEASGGGIPQQQHKGNRDEADIQIISVTSLAQRNQQTGTTAGSFTRRRTAPSPAINPILAARRRLLDKALSHRTKSFQQTPSLLRRDQNSNPGAAARSGLPKGPETYDLTNEAVRQEPHNTPSPPTSGVPLTTVFADGLGLTQTAMNSQPGGSSAPRRFPTQRPGVPVRPLQPSPRVDVRLQNQGPAPLTSSAPVNAVIRLQVPAGGQSSALRDRGSSPQDVPGRASSGVTDAGLQEQVKALGAELRGLAGALKMLVEQQCRLEREQAQQTSVQRQILSTLQSLAGQLGPSGRSAQQQLDKTPSPPSLPAASAPPAPASFSQDTLAYSQGAYTHCSQPGYNGVNGAATVEAFKLPGLGPAAVDGFPPCSNAENHRLSHVSAQPYATAYSQPQSQPLLASYSQAYLPTYTQSHSEPYRGTDSKTQSFPISCSAGALSDCSVSTQPTMNCTHASQDHQLNIIKVEGP